MKNNSDLKDVGAFNLAAAARYANVSIPTMSEWVRLPGFPAFRSGSRWVIPVDGFKSWLADRAKERAEL